jgi:hypothetical protein
MRGVDFSRRAGLVVCAAAISVALFCGAAAFAKNNDKELKAQAEALLAKSRDLSNIELAGSSPFVLTAQLRFVVDGKAGSGQGEIIWLGPGHYRETYSAPGYNYIEIAKDGERYLSRTNHDTPLVMYELKTLLETAMNPHPLTGHKIKSATTMQDASGQMLTCPEMKINDATVSACLDAEGDVTMLKTEPPKALSVMGTSYEFTSFAAFGLRRFPLNMKFEGGDGHEIVVAVQRVAPIEDVSAQHFDVPIGSMEEPWCAEPKTDTEPGTPVDELFSSPSNLGLRVLNDFAMYVEVAPGGRPRYVELIRSSKPISQKDLQNWASAMRFPVMRCGDDGIEYETEMSISAPPSVLP